MGKKDQATKDAERNRKGEAASNRRLRWKTTGESDSVELQAEAMLADQRKRPGHVDSGGVNDAEAMAEQDRQTGMKNTEAGKALEAVRKKQIEAELGKSQTSADAVANGAEVVIPTPPLRTPDNNPADTSLAPAAPGAPAAPAVGAGNPFRYGSGSKKGTGDSVSAPAPSTGQDATPPAATPPVAQGGAENVKPAVPEWQQKRTAALEALKGKFTKQDAANALAKETEPKGIDPLYQASKEQMAEPLTGADTKMPTRSAKEPLDMESKFKAMIADRPADQKAMFEALPEKEKAAMVQKNESLKMVREEEAKLGPDKNSNAEQAKALIPGAKKELQGLIDAADMMKGSPQDAMGDWEALSQNFRERRGAAEWRGTMDSVVSGAPSIQGQDEPIIIPSGNPLFGDSPDAEALYKQTSANKPSPTKEVVPETGGEPPKNPSSGDGWTKAIGDDLGSAGNFAKDYFMGGRELVNKGGKLLSGAASNIMAYSPAVMQSFVPGETGRKIREINPAGKIKDAVYDVTQFIPSKVLESNKTRSPDQASIDNKLQQREAAYRAPIDEVLGRNEFLKRFSLGDPVPT